MKNFFLNLCKTILGILGFSFVSACDGEGTPPYAMYGVPVADEYGSPYAEYFVKGKVSDENGEPIKGIAVTAPKEYPDTAFTSDDGSYELRGSFFPSDELEVKFTDVDGEENGGWFLTKRQNVKLKQQTEGEGWYSGIFGASGVDINMITETTVAEYGVPYATFEVKGKVVDSEGNPLEGIEVYGEDIYEHERQKAVTAEDGSFLLVQPNWFPSEEADICFEDVDGEENGGDFGKKKEKVRLTQTEEGEGHWNDGVYSSDDLTVTM